MRDLHYKRKRFLGKWAYQRIWLISFQEFKFEGISLDRNPTTDWEDQFTACVKDRVNFKVWTPLTQCIFNNVLQNKDIWTQGYFLIYFGYQDNIDGLVPERRNSIANALELRLSCTNLSTCAIQCCVRGIMSTHRWHILVILPRSKWSISVA